MTTEQLPCQGDDVHEPQHCLVRDRGDVIATWYRALLPDGMIWVESRDPEDMKRPGPEGIPLKFERMTVRRVYGPWQEYTP